jgi:DNA (cytosine-5)-methyltransferase 1
MRTLKVASLFCGCGGTDVGLLGDFAFLGKQYASNNMEIVYANDIDEKACDIFEQNFGLRPDSRDIRNVKSEEIPDIDILTGGFPCQSFSIIAQNPKRLGIKDQKGMLFFEMCRILRDKQPKAFIAENVKGILSANNKSAFPLILDEFRKSGYEVTYKLINAANFAVPQKRERVIIVGIRKDLCRHFVFPQSIVLKESSFTPISEIIDLSVADKYFFSDRAVQGMLRKQKNMNKGRVQELSEPCNTVGAHLAKVSLNSTDPVLFMDGRYRRFTPREVARIQSFPEDFKLVGPESAQYRALGNAIPPVMFWHISHKLVQILHAQPNLVIKESTLQGTAYDEKLMTQSFEQMMLLEKVYIYRTKPLIFQGTYRKVCRKWILENNLYNLLLTKEEFEQAPEFALVEKLLLLNGNLAPLFFTVIGHKWVTRMGLEKMGYPINRKHPTKTTYLLYSIKPCLDPIPKPEKFKRSQKGKIL